MLFVLLAPFVIAVLAPMVRQLTGSFTGWVLALLPASLFVYFCQFIEPVGSGEVLRFSTEWIPSAGINLSFYVDGLSLLFALLISGIGTFIVLYAAAYLKRHADLGRFLMFILMFMGSMLGLVLSDNVVTLFVFWELTSITSFLLIGFNHDKAKSRRAAVQALAVTGGGGLALLAGLLLMAHVGGSMELSELLAQGDLFKENPLYLSILILVLAGAFTKSAQAPFHFWLPNAMEAPTPVSAFLHSATMVKAGVYLLARMNPGLGGTEIWQVLLVVFGGATFLIGSFLALRNTDLKLILAQTTVASLGLLVLLIGLGHDKAIQAAMAYLLAHALFKGALFMAAGSVDHGTGTRDVSKLSGLARAMPLTAAASLIAALSMSGLPPFFGFIAKEFAYKASLDGPWTLEVTSVLVIGNALLFAAAFLVGAKPFFGSPGETPKQPKEGSVSLWLGPIVLSVLGLIAGPGNDIADSYFVGPAASAVRGGAMEVDLYLWGGIELPLALSAATIALGALVFAVSSSLRRALNSLFGKVWGPDQGYDQFMDGLMGLARALTGVLQTGSLRRYLLISFGIVAAALIAPTLVLGEALERPIIPPADFYIWGVGVLTVIGGLAIVLARSRLVAILSTGVLGLAVAFVFLLFGAPDLAFTQLMVETLSVVILALVIMRLPVDGKDWRGAPRALRDIPIAATIGVAVTVLLFSITSQPLDLTLSEYFAERSYTEAYGRNIVNVILVDFRALDTFGEIAVVVIAGVAVLGLLAAGSRRTESEAERRP